MNYPFKTQCTCRKEPLCSLFFCILFFLWTKQLDPWPCSAQHNIIYQANKSWQRNIINPKHNRIRQQPNGSNFPRQSNKILIIILCHSWYFVEFLHFCTFLHSWYVLTPQFHIYHYEFWCIHFLYTFMTEKGERLHEVFVYHTRSWIDTDLLALMILVYLDMYKSNMCIEMNKESQLTV